MLSLTQCYNSVKFFLLIPWILLKVAQVTPYKTLKHNTYEQENHPKKT